METQGLSRQEVIGFNLNLYARALGGHLCLANAEGAVTRHSLHRQGVCEWACSRNLEPCLSTCVRPAPASFRQEIPRITRCPLGYLVFTVPLRVDGRLAGAFGGGGLASLRGFAPDLTRLAGAPLDEAALGQLQGLAASHRAVTTRELMVALGGIKGTFESVLGSFLRQDEAEKRVRQVEGLSATMSGLYSDLPPLEWAQSFLRSLALLFDLPALFIVFPRPFLAGQFIFESFGDARLLPGPRGSNLPELFPLPEAMVKGYRLESDPLRVRAWGFPEGVRSAAFFPVGASGHTLGSVAVADREFSPAEASLVGNAVAAFALNLLVMRMERSEEELREERQYLFSLVQDLLQEEDPERIYSLLLRNVSSVTRAEKASLMLPDGEGGLRVRKALGTDEPLLARFAVHAGEGIAGGVFASGLPLWVRDMATDMPAAGPRRGHYKTNSFISFPLVSGGRTEGVLNVSDKETGTAFTRKDFDRLKIISEHSQLALARVRYLEQYRAAVQLAATDPLTGLANRRDLMRRVETELTRCRRTGRALSVVMIDVDCFKEFNDRNGHQAGDAALRVIGAILLQAVRTMDLASRYGGEEFCLVLPEVGEDGALQVAERVRAAVEHAIFPGEELTTAGRLTVSLGVAGFPRVDGSAADLLYSSDMALYRAKRDGRNRVCAGEPPPVSPGCATSSPPRYPCADP